MYSKDLVDDILKSCDIVSVISRYLTVQKKGRSYVALCPFHDDKNPSLQISPEKGIFKCFSCGTGGDAIRFVQLYEHISFPEAVRKVADIIGFHDPRLDSEESRPRVDPEKEPLYGCIKTLAEYYRYYLLTDEGKTARDYLAKRGLDEESIKRFQIGYAPRDGQTTARFLLSKGYPIRAITGIGITRNAQNPSDMNAGRVVFPLSDPSGRIVGFSARKIYEDDDGPKYMNSPETAIFQKGRCLYNYQAASSEARHKGFCYMLEGFMDVIALARSGLPAVALMGTSLTSDQVQLLRRLGVEVRISLDGDLPGQEGMMKATGLLAAAGVPSRVVDYGDDERDPDDVFQEEGAEALKAKMSNLVSNFEFQLGFYASKKKAETAEERKKVVQQFIPYIASLPSGIAKDDTIVKLAKATGFESETIRRAVERYKAAKRGESPKEDDALPSLRSKRGNSEPTQTRLSKAEREALYYMMKDRSAIKIYLENIDTFYDKVLNEIANYVINYDSSRQENVQLNILLGDIDAGPSHDKDALENEAILIYNESDLPPYSDERMRQCASTILEERLALRERRKAASLLSGKSPEEKGAALNELAKQRAARLGFKNKGT